VTRFVAADASPLIGLAAAGALPLLRELFGTVHITRLVKDEAAGDSRRPGARDLDLAMREGWLRVASVPAETWQIEGLDAGEASTIALAARRENSLVLMDDALGRAEAAARGLELLDIAGLLLAAKRMRQIEAVRPLLARLERSGFTLPARARETLLREADET
jgi:predicted nucleic acid-binding protein